MFHPLFTEFFEALDKAMVIDGDGFYVRTTTVVGTTNHNQTLARPSNIVSYSRQLFTDNGNGTFSLNIT